MEDQTTDTNPLAAEIAELRAKVAEMRDNNIGLKKQVEQFEGVDPQTVKRAMASLAQQDDNAATDLLKRGEFDKVLALQEQRMKAAHDAQMEALQRERDAFEAKAKTLTGRFGEILMAQKLDEALATKKLRLQPGAKGDLLSRAQQVFGVTADVDNLVAVDGANDVKGKPWTPDSWIDSQVDSARYLFEGGSGGGAKGGGGVGGGGQVLDRGAFRNDPEGFAKAAEAVSEGKARWSE